MLKRTEEGGMSFADFLKQGVVDVNEENNLFIALHPNDITPETTHLEIEPFTLLGYSGYDIEDAIIMNRAALDRRNKKQSGLDVDGMIRPAEKVEDGYCLANKKLANFRMSRFVFPVQRIALKFKVEITPIDTKSVQQFLNDDEAKYKSTPVTYKNPVSSYIDRVLLTTDAEGMKVYKIITRQTRRPEVGRYAAEGRQCGASMFDD
eukprot:Skav236750  [mRNA]  locus=scaffold2899:142061:145900:- [translate_table: standard]